MDVNVFGYEYHKYDKSYHIECGCILHMSTINMIRLTILDIKCVINVIKLIMLDIMHIYWLWVS